MFGQGLADVRAQAAAGMSSEPAVQGANSSKL